VAPVACVTCALTEVEFVTDVVAAGFVTVCVSAVPLADWVLLVCSPVALETAPVAAFAALDAALLADPDPHPLRSAVARPSASAATTIGIWAVDLTIVRPLVVARVRTGYTVFGIGPQVGPSVAGSADGRDVSVAAVEEIQLCWRGERIVQWG